ncbi:hypothetical protein JTE90_020221 [Oedothorax gibbosus]|uniref:MDN2-binding protein C-terminal domain-containing protein n=1 Tax=Oedothorax gibbosus TaxID=931172 RepID=A0AAV6V0C2_9ARAC|nr:hypothetical protein JTE90_020221 [Oedothorax gibbosus]
MEHYFILICKDFCIEQETFVLNYMKSLLPDQQKLKHLCTDSLPIPLLQCDLAYISVVNFYEKEELFEWKELKERTSFEPVISDCLKSVDKSLQVENVSKDHILSCHINHIADQLPSSGTYKLDVIICYDLLKEFSISSNIEFAGSLYRLAQWHGAYMVVAGLKETNELHLKEWLDVTGASILENELNSALGAVVWRGSIHSQPNTNTNNNPQELQLRLDYSENLIHLGSSTSQSTDAIMNCSEHLVLAPSLSFVDECNINTIPPYMISPITFRLSLYNSNDSSKLFEYLVKKNDVALIARLGYSINHDKLKADKSLSTSSWQKMIITGNVKFPEDSQPTTERYISFIITKSRKTDNIVVYPMRNPWDLNPQFYFTYLDALNTHLEPQIEENSGKCALEVKLPYLSEQGFGELFKKINILNVGAGEKCNGDHVNDPQHVCLMSVLESAAKGCTHPSMSLGDNASELLCEEIDPADWPERVHLLQKQICMEKEKAAAHPVSFQNLSPQRNQMNVCFTSEDASKYFEPTGEAKDKTKAEIIAPLYASKDVNKQEHDKVLKTVWPEVLKCKYDDIYYNSSSRAEELESMCNGLVRLYVQHETSCCCNREQIYPDAPILIRTRHRESSQKWKSPAKLRTPRKEKPGPINPFKLSQDNNKFVRRGSLSDLQSSRLLKKTGSFSNSMEKLVDLSRSRKQLMKSTNLLPVRQSPRKKKPVKYSQTSLSRQPKVAERNPSKSQTLPELAIKKLRVAVAQALEKNDINSDHSFFRPCFKRLFTICQAFVQDLPCKKGRTSEHMQKIADANVNQVIEFEKLKNA